MKHIIVFLLALILSACASSKKASYNNKVETSVDSSSVADNVVKRSFFDIDTSKFIKWGMTITEIEYFPPNCNDTLASISDANAMQVQSKCNASASRNTHPYVTIGSVKRWKQTTIGARMEKKGESKQAELSDSTKQATNNRRNDKTTIKEQAKTKFNVNWWIVSAIFATIFLLYLKRVPIMNTIRKILTAIRRIV